MNMYNAEHYPDPTATVALANVTREERSRRNRCVFICSPFAGDIAENTLKARRYMRFAIQKGVVPLAPHLLYPQVLEERNLAQREVGLCLGMVWLGKCDELWVFGSRITTGMKCEIEKAKKRCMPIRWFNENCEEVTT